MERLSKFVRSRMALRQSDSSDHLLGNELNAFLKGALRSEERSRALAHLSVCPECREILALVSVPSEEPVELIPARRRTAIWKWRIAAGIVAAASVVAIVWFPGFNPRQTRTTPAPVFQKAPDPNTSPKASPQISARAPEPPKVSKPKRAVLQLEQRQARTEIRDDSSPDVLNPSLPQMAERPMQPDVTSRAESPTYFSAGAQRVDALAAAPPMSQVLWDFSKDNGNEEGTLLRSNDGGRSWRPVRVGSTTHHLNALSVSGSEIWVGGADGALFHSVDNGSNWAHIDVADGESRLTGTITRIAVRDDQFIRLTVRGEGDWTSRDGGVHWQGQR